MEDPPPPRQIVTVAVLFEGGLGALACLIGWAIGSQPWELLWWDPIAVAWGLALTVPMFAMLVVVMRQPNGPTRSIVAAVDTLVVPMFRECSIVQLALVALAAGVGEELLFRGLLQPVIGEYFGPLVGVFAAGIAFGLAHPITRTYAVVAGIMGIALGGLMVVADGNLLAPIITHAAYDFAGFVYVLRFNRPKEGEPLGD